MESPGSEGVTEPVIPTKATVDSQARADVPLLAVRHLTTDFTTKRGTLRAVDDVSFELERGETLGIVGESGSGKSVLVRTIMNLLPSTASISRESQILIGGQDLRHLPDRKLRRLWGPEIAMVFQDPMTSLNPVKKVRTLLIESMRHHLGLSKRAALERGLELLDHVGISDPRRRLDQYPDELSGGLRQRITIAIALSCEPKLLIADEPTTALDVTVQRQILHLLSQLQREHDMALILITHDLGVVAQVARRVAVMYGGQIVETASTLDLFGEFEHPYTEALLHAAPRIGFEPHTPLRPIRGRPPDMVNPPPGCRFAPRCSYATEECSTSALTELTSTRSDDHRVRCLHPVHFDTERTVRGITKGDL